MNATDPDMIMDGIARPQLALSSSEMLEICYQLLFLVIGMPINIVALRRTNKRMRDGGVEGRLMQLSRQLLIAHILVLFVYCFWRTYWIYKFFWVQGDFLCRVFSFVSALGFHLWSNLVAAIAVDMLCCVRSPLSSYRNGATRVKYFIATSWLLAVVCAFPMLIFRGTVAISVNERGDMIRGDDANPECLQCHHLNYSMNVLLAHNFAHVITVFYVPLAIIVTCYTAIGVALHRQMAARKLLADAGVASRSSATKARFLRASFAIVCTFFFTWLPYQVLNLINVICIGRDEVCLEGYDFLQALIVASTCINPFLYRFGASRGTSERNRSCRFQSASTFESSATRLGQHQILNGQHRRVSSAKASVLVMTRPEATGILPFLTSRNSSVTSTIG